MYIGPPAFHSHIIEEKAGWKDINRFHNRPGNVPMTVDEKMLFFVELYRIKMSLQNNIKAARKLRAA